MVGEDGSEIVDFKTAVNVVPVHRTQETLKTLVKVVEQILLQWIYLQLQHRTQRLT